MFFLVLFLLVSGPAVVGHSCCGVPANVLSVCLFGFFFGESNKKRRKLERFGPTLKFQVLIGYACKNHTKIIIVSSPVIKVACD